MSRRVVSCVAGMTMVRGQPARSSPAITESLAEYVYFGATSVRDVGSGT